MSSRNVRKKILFFMCFSGAVLVLSLAQVAMAGYFVTPDVYWQLEAADPSAGTLDEFGIVNGTCGAGGCPAGEAVGQIGNAYDFSGGDVGIDFLDNAAFDFAAVASFSIELWMKLDAAPAAGNPDVMIGRTDGNTVWWVGVDEDGTAACFFDDATVGLEADQINGYSNVADGSWHHIVVTRDGAADRLSLYVDGVLEIRKDQSADTSTDDGFASAANLNLGNMNSNYYYGGLLDNVAIYNGDALSLAFIQQNYLNGGQGIDLDGEFAPVFSGNAVDSLGVGFEATLVARAAGNPMPAYTSTNLPDGASIDGATGNITWRPTNLQIGANAFAVSAANGLGAAATQNWTVNVEDLCITAIGAHWKLEETDPLNDGTLDQIGVVDGSCIAGSCPASVAGKIGNAYDFSGGNYEVAFSDAAVFDFAAVASFSIELWMKLDAAPAAGNPDVMIGRTDGNTIWWIGVDEDGTVACLFDDVTAGLEAVQINGYTNVADDTWHHIVVTRDAAADALSLYVDGALEYRQDQSTDTSTEDGFDSAADVTLGRLISINDYYYGGLLDEVAIYDGALTASMIAQHASPAADQNYCNVAPVIDESVVVTEATQGEPYGFTALATDTEGNALTWTLAQSPTGMAINSSTGEVTWTPGGDSDTVNVTLVVTDEFGGADSYTYTISVTITEPTPSGGGGGGGGGGCFINMLIF